MANPSGMAALRSTVATSAIHNGARDEGDYTDVCHEGTREEYLKDLATSADNPPVDRRLHWANAIAGAGKTALLRTFCQLLEQRGHSFASFFIWKNDSKRNNLRHFPATIAHQLSRRITALVPHIERVFLQDPLVLESTFENQMLQLVINPLLNAADVVKELHHIIIVVDGLDELNLKAQTQFLKFIPNFLSQLSSLPISALVSSRPDAEIVAAFKHPRLASITRATRLGASDEDIWKFINDKFDDINLQYPDLQIECGGQWPSHVKRAIMVRQSSGLFIWPTVAINYIDKVALGLGHNKRLEQVLSSAEPKPWIASPLDNLYRAILQAHAPEDPGDLLRFNQRLAYLCLPVRLGTFVLRFRGQAIDWTDIPVRALFEETLDELWGSVAGLSSLFSPRTTLTKGESPTPAISHLSFRDFTFNRARCDDKFYYSSEREVHAEIVCKFLKFFNTRQAYQSRAEMSAEFIIRAGECLKSHLKESAVSEELGRCMDDVMLDVIPPTWPLVTQIFAIVNLFDGLYKLADSPEFPDGSQRREAFLSKLAIFFKNRAANAEGCDIALFRLALPTIGDFDIFGLSHHTVHCWHIARSALCACIDVRIPGVALGVYQGVLGGSTLFQHAKSRLPPYGKDDIAKDTLDVMQFIISLSETSPRAIQLSSFIQVRIDQWIIDSLKHCPPNDDLYNTLGRICTAPLPDLPKRAVDSSSQLVATFLLQTEAFNAYTKRCREAGIETNFPPIRIPDDWWEDKGTRRHLLLRGYKPPFNIPDDWWEIWETRGALLKLGYKPSFEIPNKWWDNEDTREDLLQQGYVQPTPTSQPMKLLGSAASHLSSSQPQSLLFSSSNPSSITPSSDIVLDTPASDVDDVLRAPLPIDPPHAEPAQAPALAPVLAEEVVASETNGPPASDVEDTGTTLATVIPSQAFALAVPIPESVSGIDGAQPLGQRRRGRVRTFFNKLIPRP